MEFVWDPVKAERNLRKHGISFEQASQAFYDPFAIEFEDDRYDYKEIRNILIGNADQLLVVVVHVERDETIRIISARRAEPNERRYYRTQNG